MASEILELFRGELPRYSANLLPEGNAQRAINAKLIQGNLQPWNSPATVTGLGTVSASISSLIRYNADGGGLQPQFLAWTADVEVARSTVPGDTDQRIYWTDGVAPKMSSFSKLATGGAQIVTDTANYWLLGVPAPVDQAQVSLSGGPPTLDSESYTYYYAWVFNGRIGALSAALSITVAQGQYPTLDNLDTAQPDTRSGWKKWVFRYDSVSLQYVRVAILNPGDVSWNGFGQKMNKAYKSGQFNKITPAVTPVAGATIAATTPDSTVITSRTYEYCFMYQIGTTWYHTAISAASTALPAQKTDAVYISGMEARKKSDFPAGAAKIKKIVFRSDGAATFRQVAAIAPGQADYTDVISQDKLGKGVRGTLSAIFGAPLAPTTAVSNDTTALTTYTRYYVYTYVTSNGEESAPSDPTEKVWVVDYQTVTVNWLTNTAPTGYANIVSRRLYRTDQIGQWRLASVAGDIPLATTSYVDELDDTQLGDVLKTTTWATPPAGLRGITEMPNGVLAGFVGNQVYFTESYVPYAWPYSISTNWPVTGIAMCDAGLVVGTEGQPYIIEGTDPAAFSPRKLKLKQACVSLKSMVDMGEFVVYASPDGLVKVDSTGAFLFTYDIVTRDQWQAIVPTSIRATRYGLRYLMFYNTGTVSQAWVIDPANIQDGIMELQVYSRAPCMDLYSGALFLQIGGAIQKFDAGAAMTATYRTRKYITEQSRCPAAAIVVADTYPVTFTLYADGVAKGPYTVSDYRPFRPDSGYLAKSFEAEVTCSGVVRKIGWADSVRELKSV